MNKTQKRMLANIYDIIIKSQFENEARKELNRYRKNKNIEVDFDHGIISIGKGFTIKIIK